MVQVFENITQAELDNLMSQDVLSMDVESLNNLRNAAKKAGILTSQYENMLAIAINNRRYEEIQKDDNYSKEEKEFALKIRNEYNKELRSKVSNKLYNAEEILSKAVFKDGAYHFADLSKGEMDFLLDNGLVHPKELNVDASFQLGQIKAEEIPSVAKDNAQLSDDVKKSQEFWGNFNDKKSALSCMVQALQDNALKVEAKQNKKKVFTGVDHGNKGFDVVHEEKKVEPYAVFDLIIKKAKMANPNAKIRIKDNIKDEETRNKILIACAKNNMEPIGNLPKDFDFELLKQIAKEAKTTEDINALAKNLYGNAPFSVEQKQENKENQAAVAIVPAATAENKKDDKDKNNVVAGVVPVAAPTTKKDEKEEKKVVVAPKRSWWKKVKDAVVVAGIAVLGFIGVKSCQNQEKLQKNIKDLQEQVDKKSLDDCNELSARFAAEYAQGFEDGKKACEDEKKPQPKKVVRRVSRAPKKVVVAHQPQKIQGLELMDGVGMPIQPVATAEIPDYVENIDLPKAPEEKVVEKPQPMFGEINTSQQHEEFNSLEGTAERNNQGKLVAENKTLDASDPAVFNQMYQKAISTKSR